MVILRRRRFQVAAQQISAEVRFGGHIGRDERDRCKHHNTSITVKSKRLFNATENCSFENADNSRISSILDCSLNVYNTD